MRLKRVILSMAILVLTGASTGMCQEVDEKMAAALKAAFMPRIAQYTQWPDEVFPDEASSIIIQVLGSDPHGVEAVVAKAIKERKISAHRRPIEIRSLSYVPDGQGTDRSERDAFESSLINCHMLFVTRSESAHWEDISSVLTAHPVATVGEIDGFAESGGMIGFVPSRLSKRSGKVGMDMHINLEAVRGAELQLSAKLLSLKKGVKIVRR